MRIALVSDVHGNLPAFEAVMEDVRESAAEETWCLGDLVGYGAQPEACVELARETCDVCLAGNHDLVVIEEIDIGDFSHSAAAAALWTRENISEETAGFLRDLDPVDTGREPALYHASPRDPVWEYILSEPAAEAAFAATTEPLVLVGHSHIALAIVLDDRGVHGGTADAGTELELRGARHLLNPGSVGQPRDGDPRAAWLVIDTSSARATFRRTGYPIELTQAEMRERGLPEVLATRLAYGA
jgi:diadenosine tetraphosphatase ApaH/serine/threonine PP2A family protein phosphatase